MTLSVAPLTLFAIQSCMAYAFGKRWFSFTNAAHQLCIDLNIFSFRRNNSYTNTVAVWPLSLCVRAGEAVDLEDIWAEQMIMNDNREHLHNTPGSIECLARERARARVFSLTNLHCFVRGQQFGWIDKREIEQLLIYQRNEDTQTK